MKLKELTILFLLVSTFPHVVFASETINCHFDKFHQTNHEKQSLSGYAEINQSLEIVDFKTSKNTLSKDGSERATNSMYWVLLENKNWELESLNLAGDFGELLVIEVKKDIKSPEIVGWFMAKLVDVSSVSTKTRLGKCFIQ
ncbi:MULTISPECIES: hypothetical protein [Alteromonas]|jgi:hypothetical protein|uniref:Lipoprotein n=1 Tax=Alteromonas macleodii TaxID=28108 RepID=A0A126Q2H9_ALTMA|nr:MULTISPECIES: hypothetical protein [Alteromonas]AMJ98659.1 hypothetical protein AVL55_11060 [Alteromonas macleodii]MCG7649934.1 hypothetical protein [Alteromonas sp. MmMcT2-5]|tara:strand:+ start:508 stop:933 length:426 start_codon:yes stop_codon:yes gene_type:complete